MYYRNVWSTAMDPLVHVYFFDPVIGEIRYEAMRSPGAMPSNSPRLQYVPGQRKPLTLGKDTRGFIQDLVVCGDHAVYFIVAPPSRWESLSEKQRKDKIRRAKIQVRQMELKALEQEAALVDDGDEPDDDLDDDDDSESNSSYGDNTLSLSVSDCRGGSSVLSSEESQYSRDSFSFEDSFSVDDLGRNGSKDEADEVDESQHQGDEDKQRNDNEHNKDIPDEFEITIAPVPPSHPPATTLDSLPSETSLAPINSKLSPTTTSPKWTSRRLPRHRRGFRGKPSPLRRLIYSAPAEDDSSTQPALEIQGEQRSNKRKADDDQDLRTVVKKVKTAHPSDIPPQTTLGADLPRPPTPSHPASSLAVSEPAPKQQATSLKRKREEDEDDWKTSGSSQPDKSDDSGPAAKKLKIKVPPLSTGRRQRRPNERPPLVRKMWDKLMTTKLAALKLGATFSDFGFRSSRKKTRRPRGTA